MLQDMYCDAIRVAIKHGHLEIVKILTSSGFGMKNEDCSFVALVNGRLDIIEYLVSQGGGHTKRQQCRTLLEHMHIICPKHRMRVIEYLLSHSITFEYQISAHYDILRSAMRCNDLKLLKFIMPKFIWTPESTFVQNSDPDEVDARLRLLDKLIRLAIQTSTTETLDYLLEQYSDYKPRQSQVGKAMFSGLKMFKHVLHIYEMAYPEMSADAMQSLLNQCCDEAIAYGHELPILIYLIGCRNATYSLDLDDIIHEVSSVSVIKYLLTLHLHNCDSDILIETMVYIMANVANYDRIYEETKFYEVPLYLVENCAAPIELANPEQREFIQFHIRMNALHRTRAASKIYFWWIPICHGLEGANPAGIRMAYLNLVKFESLCAS
jgi:hypothetical protein